MIEDQFKKDISDSEKYDEARLANLWSTAAGEPARKILIEKEFARRERKEQHELDLKLIEKQVRWMKFAVGATIIAALLGAIVGAILQKNLQSGLPQMPPAQVQQQSAPSPEAHHTEKGVLEK
jgi:hypothetical protein